VEQRCGGIDGVSGHRASHGHVAQGSICLVEDGLDLRGGDHHVYAVLDQLGIRYDRFEHPPVATVDAAIHYWASIDAMHSKNLFLRNKKGDRHYLIVVEHTKPVDLRVLAGRLGDDRLSFGSAERLMTHLGVQPGSVSPFALLNDPHHRVQPVLDAMVKHAAFVAFHPNVNTATVRLSGRDFQRFLDFTGHAVRWLEL